MPITMTRAVQVPLPIPASAATSRPRRRTRRTVRRARTPQRLCDNCRGPVARGEGFLTCVVCGLHRAA